MDNMVYFVPFGIITGLLGIYVANQKNRSGVEGFTLGFLFSIFGVIILALLPSKEASLLKKSNITKTKPITEPLSSEEKNVVGVLAIIVMLVIIYTLWSRRN